MFRSKTNKRQKKIWKFLRFLWFGLAEFEKGKVKKPFRNSLFLGSQNNVYNLTQLVLFLFSFPFHSCYFWVTKQISKRVFFPSFVSDYFCSFSISYIIIILFCIWILMLMFQSLLLTNKTLNFNQHLSIWRNNRCWYLPSEIVEF